MALGYTYRPNSDGRCSLVGAKFKFKSNVEVVPASTYEIVVLGTVEHCWES